ncbi:MAG: hypothetical protein Q4C14_04345 [Bacillota bacterium]|nr:hypothetical protein [Bacillota bacterium]
MKKISIFFLAVMLCMFTAGCGKETVQNDDSQDICIEESVAGIGITCYIGDEPFQSGGMYAADGEELGRSYAEVTVRTEDIPNGANLDDFGIGFTVKETGGIEFSVCTVHFPAEQGRTYSFELRNEDGCYVILSEADGQIYSGECSKQPGNEAAEKVETVGPWHLDEDRNDLNEFANSLDLFPGYGEWGASMEIRSSGQMSWFIGAESWHGTYTVEDDIIHGNLVSDMDQSEKCWDFRIIEENEAAVLEMKYEDMTIYWAYGDREDAANGGDNN